MAATIRRKYEGGGWKYQITLDDMLRDVHPPSWLRIDEFSHRLRNTITALGEVAGRFKPDEEDGVEKAELSEGEWKRAVLPPEDTEFSAGLPNDLI